MEMSEIQAARLLLGGSGLFGSGGSRRAGGYGSSTQTRYGTVASVNGDGTATIELDGGGGRVTLRTDTPLRAGDRVTIVVQGGVSMVYSMAAVSDAISAQEQELIDFSKSLGDLGEQVDGKVETWFYAYAPTTGNEPASGWSDSDKQAHSGDLFYDTSTGYCYRWTGTAWSQITDRRIQGAMDAASRAEDTADSKRRVFTSQPYGPYDKGDLWVTNTSGTGDLYVCKTPEGNTGKFYSSDWVKATRYTDDEAVETLAESFSLLAQRVPVKYRVAGAGGNWVNSGGYTTWYTLKPTAVDGTAPMLFWCSISLTTPECTRAYSYGYASYYEWMVQWPTAAGVVSNDKLPEVFVGATCEGNTADAYSWNRSTDGLGPLILVTHASGKLPATRMEVFCASRI